MARFAKHRRPIWLVVAAVAFGQLACAAGNEDTSAGDDSSGGGGSGDTTFVTSAQGSGGMAPGVTGSGSGVGSGTGAGGPGGPIGTYAPGDVPLFQTPAELCAYVNEQRLSYASHDRYSGPPWSGEYHQNVTWPLELAIDAELSSEAQAEATALAGGKAPAGAPYSDGSPPPHQYLYVSGVSSASYAVASQEGAGDWTTDIAGNLTAGITTNNGTARMAMFYQDAGVTGPALTRVGCGGAATPAGGRWWVVMMAP